jgi:hypothetical protein
MNTREISSERPGRPSPRGPGAPSRVAEPPRRAASGSLLRNLTLYRVPRVVEDRGASIAKLAYLMAQRRGFAPGHELDDWLAAENEVDQRLAGEGRVF